MVALAALVLATGLALYPALRARELVALAAILGAAGVMAAVISMAKLRQLVGVALFLLAAEYAVVQVVSGLGLAGAAVYPAGLLVLGELLFWAVELARLAALDRAIVAGKVLMVGLTAVGGMLAAVIALATAAMSPIGAAAGALAGGGAAVGVFAVLLLLVGRASRRA